MLIRSLLHVAVPSTLAATLFILTIGCGEKESPEETTEKEKSPLVYGQRVQGKVTYKGEPVTYGLVLLYNDEHSFSPEKRTFAPIAFGPIQSDGTYTLENAPLGVHRLVVATDPDQDVMSYTRPIPLEGNIGPPTNMTSPGGPPGMPPGGPPIGPPGGPPGIPGPPAKGKDGKFAPPPPPKATKGQKPAEPSEGPPTAPPPVKLDFPVPKMPNPKADKMSDAEKRLLREVHTKYGSLDKSTRLIVVREGTQTFDIELK
ncbi:MAG: hypothetical protein RMJ56_00495 [Gemmataceae bacterium]|nr:hypothetical protein [Gemmata sp.]MDW8196059.1 hypothetical protein [Gemmataceae bacterium]